MGASFQLARTSPRSTTEPTKHEALDPDVVVVLPGRYIRLGAVQEACLLFFSSLEQNLMDMIHKSFKGPQTAPQMLFRMGWGPSRACPDSGPQSNRRGAGPCLDRQLPSRRLRFMDTFQFQIQYPSTRFSNFLIFVANTFSGCSECRTPPWGPWGTFPAHVGENLPDPR